jgi:hypothetical protein
VEHTAPQGLPFTCRDTQVMRVVLMIGTRCSMAGSAAKVLASATATQS